MEMMVVRHAVRADLVEVFIVSVCSAIQYLSILILEQCQ